MSPIKTNAASASCVVSSSALIVYAAIVPSSFQYVLSFIPSLPMLNND